MDSVSERERSSRKSRDERETDRSSGKDHHRDRDHERDRDRKHRHRHDDEEQRHGSRNEKHRGDDDGDRHRRHSRADSPRDVETRRGRSYSIERSKEDSVPDLEPRRERSSDKHSKDDEKHRDGDRRHHRSGTDSPPCDLEPRRERSPDGIRDSVERGKDSGEQATERHRHASKKRKDHGEIEDSDKRGKRVRGSDGSRDERRERRRFADRAVEDENGAYREERAEEKDSRKGELLDEDHDREKKRVAEDDFGYKEERKSRRERRFSDRTKAEEKREEHGFKDNVKDDHLKSTVESKPSVVMNGDLNNLASEKSGSSVNVSQEPLTLTSKVSMTSAASRLPVPTKVSSITTTNENGVNITRSDEVPGKSSTDGTTTSVAGRSGSLTLDALAKAKKALQIQRELKEKMKKIPMLNKLATPDTDINSQSTANKGGAKIPTSVVASTTSAFVSPVQTTSSGLTLPVGAATSENITAAAGVGVIPGLTTTTNYEAVKRAQELAAKMGFRQDPEFAPLINMFPGPSSAADVGVPQKPTKAPVLRIDAQGREVDEHGNVINMPKLTNLSTLKVNINKQKKEAFQILRPELDADTKSNPHFDMAMGIDKTKLLRPKRMSFQFVEEGRWSKQAEIIKFKSQFGEAQAKELKTKQSQLAKAKGEVDNPNLIELPDRANRAPRDKKDDIPEIEWWDKPLLPSGGYIDIGSERLNMEKITIYIEHPRPIEPPAEPAPPPPQPLKLTKKEQKKLRTQRRLAKEKERQEMIRQGIIEPPKSKVKMSNLMKVLGTEATQDPTRLEMEVRSAAAEREQAHVDRNIARKLTPAERRDKKARKLFEDPSTLETLVSVYKIKDLSHPQTRFKVDVNAQENRLTGVTVISDGVTVVAVEGGKKPIKRYGKLMLKRINWAAAIGDGEEGDGTADVPVNSCVLVWQGSVAKPSFHRFLIHQCRTEAAAKKVFADAGVPHYWDLAINFTDEIMEG